jgi:hypothetical protein
MKNRFTSQPGLKFLSCNRRLPFLGVLALICLLALSSQPVIAQTVTGSMVGNVTDPSGGSVPGANIKITSIATNDVRTVQADTAGAYTIAAVEPGTYKVEVTQQGFRTFVVDNILVNQNNVVRVDAQLQVGALAERVEVTTQAAAALETERADVHTEIATTDFIELPQPTRTYEGLFAMIPGSSAAGASSGGTNNPAKSMTYAFNGSNSTATIYRIEGINTMNTWTRADQSYVPSTEAIQNVNVATNATDAEQGFAGGASVNVTLKSGSNETHGAAYEYNVNAGMEANNFFAQATTTKPPHLVDNDFGGNMGGHILKNKLFYWGGYEVDLTRQATSGIYSIPNQAQLTGNLSGSTTPIYDPTTGTAAGANRTPFPGNIIPASRFDPVVLKIIPNIPATNIGGAAQDINNLYANIPNQYNLHKIDSKLDWNVSPKLRLSGHFGYQPYYDFNQPLYGLILGGGSNYLQHGAGLAVTASGSYIISPTFIIDANWGKTNEHQLLFPNQYDTRYGLNTLGIPGTNIGPLPWAGGVPDFGISNFSTFGASYPSLEYNQPIYEYVANATKIKGSHTIRFGADLSYENPRHIEVRNNEFFFNGNMTTESGGPGATPYNALADFLLGDFDEGQNWAQFLQPYLTMNSYEFATYIRDQWHVSPKLTINYGTRWEYYPVPTRSSAANGPSSEAPNGLGTTGNGIYFLNMQNETVSVCGAGGIPTNCGIAVSHKLFAPSIGIAYRPFEKFVIRAGYNLSPYQEQMGTTSMQAFPGEMELDELGVNNYTPAGHLTTGLPIITPPPSNASVFPILPNTGNLTGLMTEKQFTRGYYQSYNVTVQRELPFGVLGSLGWAGTHALKLQLGSNGGINLNYAPLGGGNASMPLANIPDYSTGVSALIPWGADKYNSLQIQLNKRLSNGLSFQFAETYSKDIYMSTSILIPQYIDRDYYVPSSDRTQHVVLTATYELPFGRGKAMLTQGPVAAIVGGWMVNGIFNHYSGAPYTISASASSCNCPGNSQTANLVKSSVAQVGSGVGGQAYFDPLAYAPVTTVAFGTSGFDQLRGPGSNNADMSVFRSFRLTERFKLQFRVEAMNVTNTPHFGNPGTNVSNLQLNSDGSIKNLNGFSQITGLNTVSRLIDPRYIRLGARITF